MDSSSTAVTLTSNLNGYQQTQDEHTQLEALRSSCGSKKYYKWSTSARRLQAPTPTPAVTEDTECTTKLETLLKVKDAKVTQLNDLLTQAVAGKCTSTSRRLRRRVMKLKSEKRILQAPTPKSMCDTAQKAVLLGLANLTLSSSYVMYVAVAGILSVSAMFF